MLPPGSSLETSELVGFCISEDLVNQSYNYICILRFKKEQKKIHLKFIKADHNNTYKTYCTYWRVI